MPTSTTITAMQGDSAYSRHRAYSGYVNARASDLFRYLDDHRRLSSHMSESSWRMAGSHMDIVLDEGQGQRPGSRIRLHGRVLRLNVSVETVVTEHAAPRAKVWQTVQAPRLLVIGAYRMGFEIAPQSEGSQLRVFIDYELPVSGLPRVLGRLLGNWYAAWCTRQMVQDAQAHYAKDSQKPGMP